MVSIDDDHCIDSPLKKKVCGMLLCTTVCMYSSCYAIHWLCINWSCTCICLLNHVMVVVHTLGEKLDIIDLTIDSPLKAKLV